jgi:hypothetical protein
MSIESDADDGTKWEGYSDYQRVSLRIGQSIDDALDSYAELDSRHQENAQVSAEVAASARRDILSAAMRLIPELKNDRSVDDKPYDNILSRWQGEDGQTGYIARLNSVNLTNTCPGWLFQMALDLRMAGWHLGYLRAGRTGTQDPDDPTDATVSNMLN